MFVDVKESSIEARAILSKAWNSRDESKPLAVTSINMLIHDSPTLTEPRFKVLKTDMLSPQYELLTKASILIVSSCCA